LIIKDESAYLKEEIINSFDEEEEDIYDSEYF
jgi:hypothetical protein